MQGEKAGKHRLLIQFELKHIALEIAPQQLVRYVAHSEQLQSDLSNDFYNTHQRPNPGFASFAVKVSWQQSQR